jgi:hypothetical protein
MKGPITSGRLSDVRGNELAVRVAELVARESYCGIRREDEYPDSYIDFVEHDTDTSTTLG